MAPQSVIVTGAANGIGEAVTLRLAHTGWKVVAVDIDPRVESLGSIENVIPLVGSVAVPATHVRAAELAAAAAPIKGWVNNAAVQLDGAAGEITLEQIRVQLDVNVVGAMLGCSEAVRAMRGGGSIVSVSSIHALVGFHDAFVYAASKGAVVAMARQLAVDYGSRGVRSNVVLPGAIDTAMCRDGWALAADPAAARRADESLHLMNRMGTAEEVADVIDFLLSARSSLINGQAIVADGGAVARAATA